MSFLVTNSDLELTFAHFGTRMTEKEVLQTHDSIYHFTYHCQHCCRHYFEKRGTGSVGCELALACDYRVADESPKTEIGLPEDIVNRNKGLN